jgi:hypothetical protein
LNFGRIDRRSLANLDDNVVTFDLPLDGKDSKTDFSLDILVRRDNADLFVLHFAPFDPSISEEEVEEEEDDDDDDEEDDEYNIRG